MKNKILAIGSTIACIILLVASLSPVVGYNSARSSVKDSPLFNIRTKRAINQESDGLTCEYIGKGELLPLPIRSGRTALIRKAIDRISNMDEKTFNKFQEVLVEYLEQKNFIKYEMIDEIFKTLNQIRINPTQLLGYAVTRKDSNPYTTGCTLYGDWIPGCLIGYCIVMSLYAIYVILYYLITGEVFTSDSMGCEIS